MIDLFTVTIPKLLPAVLNTVSITALALIMGFGLGTFLGIGSCRACKHPLWSYAIRVYVSILRGTPLFVQVLLAYFAIPQLFGFNLSPFMAGVWALGLNSSAYICEIIRGGLDAIPKGQWLAAKALGYSLPRVFISIICPQVYKNVLPSLVNETTTLLKDTSILMVIGVTELTKAGRDIVARELDPFKIYVGVALIYLALTSGISYVASRFERTYAQR